MFLLIDLVCAVANRAYGFDWPGVRGCKPRLRVGVSWCARFQWRSGDRHLQFRFFCARLQTAPTVPTNALVGAVCNRAYGGISVFYGLHPRLRWGFPIFRSLNRWVNFNIRTRDERADIKR